MLYLSGNKNNNLLGVVDTDDNIEEFYTKDFLETCDLEIIGINKKLPLGYKFETKYFNFTLVEIDNLIGWKLRYKDNISIFRSKSRYLGYPVISLEGCFKNYNFANIDVSEMDTSNVIDMFCMFDGCKSLTTLDLSSFNTSNVTDMTHIFSVCESLTALDLSNFDTSNVTNMAFMFDKCKSLTTLDLSNFDTSNITSMVDMFWGCTNLQVINVSSKKLFNSLRENNINCIILVPKSLGVKYKQVITSDIPTFKAKLALLGITEGVYAYE